MSRYAYSAVNSVESRIVSHDTDLGFRLEIYLYSYAIL